MVPIPRLHFQEKGTGLNLWRGDERVDAYRVNKSDLGWLRWVFDALDGKDNQLAESKRRCTMTRADEFLCGVLAALGCVYDADEETLAEEIVYETGASALFRVAKVNEDYFLPNLRKTIKFLRERKAADG